MTPEDRARKIRELMEYEAIDIADYNWEHLFGWITQAVTDAEADMKGRAARVAEGHGLFCREEARKGGAPELKERAEGGFHIAAAIRGME